MWGFRVIINRVDRFGVKEESGILIRCDHKKKDCTEMGRLIISKKCAFQERFLETKKKFTRKIVLHEYEIVQIDC